ncbi:MotE family protein [Lentibacillus saliphilus]|uniref:MotE family protein n=1 Tax=Lentibacillus saliphilus TaxID=2737028 RepID=UPI001C3112AC|nr:hypothetical protein [Lentibacillus saliphilus]
MANEQTKNNINKQKSPWIWILFIVIIPTCVAVALSIIVLQYAGVNMSEWAKEKAEQIPIVSSYVSTEEEAESEPVDEAMWKKRLANKNEEIDQLNNEIRELEHAIAGLEQDVASFKSADVNEHKQQEQHEELLSSIAQTFNKIDGQQAALIMKNLDNDLAVHILKQLSNDARSRILEAMQPEQAAELTQIFVNID